MVPCFPISLMELKAGISRVLCLDSWSLIVNAMPPLCPYGKLGAICGLRQRVSASCVRLTGSEVHVYNKKTIRQAALSISTISMYRASMDVRFDMRYHVQPSRLIFAEPTRLGLWENFCSQSPFWLLFSFKYEIRQTGMLPRTNW